MLDLAKVTAAGLRDRSGLRRRPRWSSRRPNAAPVRCGVEFNPEMVELSRQRRQRRRASPTGRRSSKATCTRPTSRRPTVLALFLLPENLRRLEPKFRALPAGTRIVVNTFGIPDWTAEATETVGEDCRSWGDGDACTACRRAPISWISHALTTVRLRPHEG